MAEPLLRAAMIQVRRGLQLARLVRRGLTAPVPYDVEVMDRLGRRDQNFLQMVERQIFGHPGSPYRPLLDLAGYDLPRLRQLVAARGPEGALDQLWADGVYVRVDEFKGWRPIERRGRSFRFAESDFANPTMPSLFQITSGMSRSRGSLVNVPAEDLVQQARLLAWLLKVYGLEGRDVVIWTTPGTALSLALGYAVAGRPPLRWFSLVREGNAGSSILYRTARVASGMRLPPSGVASAARAAEVARYISQVNTSRGLIVETFATSALRLVLAAAEEKIPLGDVVFIVTGEPITARKRREVEGRGFPLLPRFGMNELGRLVWACAAPSAADDMHVMTDMIAVRTYPRALDDGATTVPAYLFTTLLTSARNVMLNMETGDYGRLEARSCGCVLDTLGLRQHMAEVRSFEKLTAEGMTFAGPYLIELIEEVLPRHFGGDSRHYQFVEEEDPGGFTRLFVLASPLLGDIDEEALREVVLTQLGGRPARRAMSGVWEDAGTIRVLRREPLPTRGGKILHLHRHRGVLATGEEGATVVPQS